MKQFHFILILLLSLSNLALSAQQILLDNPIRAAELRVFPELGETHNYYYLADKPRLATHPDGKPMLSFIRFVKNQQTNGETNSAITESQIGGGVVHALVELSVSEEQVRDAENAVKRIDPLAKIVGPVVFKSGTVALVSAVANKDGGYAQSVVGLGSAPILENQKAAVAVLLNPLGARILWETFNTPTPDFSFYFEMEVPGYQKPKRITIDADFEQMYKNKTFEAAIAMPVLQAEIGIAIDEMINNGAIKVTQIGEDASLDRVRDVVINQLTNLMFQRVGGTGVPQVNELMGMNNRPGVLDRATNMLQKNREEARNNQNQNNSNNTPPPANNNGASNTNPGSNNSTAGAGNSGNSGASNPGTNTGSTSGASPTTGSNASGTAGTTSGAASGTAGTTSGATTGAAGTSGTTGSTTDASGASNGSGTSGSTSGSTSGTNGNPANTTTPPPGGNNSASTGNASSSGRPASPPANSGSTGNSRPSTTNGGNTGNNRPANQNQQQSSGSSFAIAISYRIREMKQTGKYHVDLNKYTEITKSMPFAYNPGNVKKQCPSCFREVNLDDPLMQQRDINATLGGLNTQDFAQFVNFVNVVLRKKHEDGQETVSEIKIDKTQFNLAGNFFKMQYGYKGDKDRLKWLNYDYKTKWSFFGDFSIETPWTSTDFGSIALEPPFVRKTIFFEADPDFINEQGVRAVEAVIYSNLGTKTDVKTVQLKTNKNELSKSIDILLPRGVEDYEYELTWFLKGQDPKKTARKKSQYGRIDLDRF